LERKDQAMKVTREQAAANREKIVEVASILFRKHGFEVSE